MSLSKTFLRFQKHFRLFPLQLKSQVTILYVFLKTEATPSPNTEREDYVARCWSRLLRSQLQAGYLPYSPCLASIRAYCNKYWTKKLPSSILTCNTLLALEETTWNYPALFHEIMNYKFKRNLLQIRFLIWILLKYLLFNRTKLSPI